MGGQLGRYWLLTESWWAFFKCILLNYSWFTMCVSVWLYIRLYMLIYMVYIHIHALVNPKLPVHPFPNLPPPWQPQVCSLCLWVCFCFVNKSICAICEIPRKWYRVILVSVRFPSLSVIISRSIRVAASFHSFYNWVVFHCAYMHHVFFIHSSADGFKLLPCLDYWK